MKRALLEIIAVDARDAVAAQKGGADRLEVCRDLAAGGLAPAPEVLADIRDCVELPLRVMLRTAVGFAVGNRVLRDLGRLVPEFVDAGADGFVFGFLTPEETLDLDALRRLVEAVTPRPWTLHHAFDHAREAQAAWDEAFTLPGLDLVLTGGDPHGLPAGAGRLEQRAAWQTDRVRWLAGGGVDARWIAHLRRHGFLEFHCGRAARTGGCWDRPVSTAAVRRLRRAAG